MNKKKKRDDFSKDKLIELVDSHLKEDDRKVPKRKGKVKRIHKKSESYMYK
jgi:hypothetical protein